MAGQYIGVSGVARKVKNQMVGVSGVARKVKTGYVGVSGVARKHYNNSVTLTVTGTMAQGAYGVEIDGTYYGAGTYKVAYGSTLVCHMFSSGVNSQVYVNDVWCYQSYAQNDTYNYTITKDTTVEVNFNSGYNPNTGYAMANTVIEIWG